MTLIYRNCRNGTEVMFRQRIARIDIERMFGYNKSIIMVKERAELKVIAKLIEMLALFTRDGVPTPVRFKITNKDETESVIKINRIIKTSEERLI